MIEKINVNVPLIDILHIPSYAKYIRDIISNKRPLPTSEVVKLTEECSVLFDYPDKKKDLGCPTISCSIGMQFFQHALCDLGASVSVMPKAIFDELIHTPLTPTPMLLQLADSTFHQPAGIVKNIPVRIGEFHVPVDFVVLDMKLTKGAPLKEAPLILGRPFLSTAAPKLMLGPVTSVSKYMVRK
jgi:hypothetical protein